MTHSMPLNHVVRVGAGSKTYLPIKHAVEVEMEGGRLQHFFCDSVQAQERWLEALGLAIWGEHK